ncbi:MAG: hypothetical protein LBL17_04440 [Coxiellaceae bacterium]|jgi:ABC-type amino acid transport substrate-binding protein|nr:hypothetical protein [Coxiellaceae bacterium]
MSKKTYLYCILYLVNIWLILTSIDVSAGIDSQPKVTTIRFATEVYPPFTTLGINKKLGGFDIEIAEALC